MPRLRRTDKRRHEVTLETLIALAHVRAYGDPEPWVAHWGGAAEARAAFEALRYERAVAARVGESYEEWLARIGEAEPA